LLCSECFARGTECISQEFTDQPPPPSNRKNLRERVSRIENLLEVMARELSENRKLLQSLQSASVFEDAPHHQTVARVKKRKRSHSIESDGATSDNRLIQQGDRSQSASNLDRGSDLVKKPRSFWSESLREITSLSDRETKDMRVRHALTSILPRGERLRRALRKCNGLWGRSQKPLLRPGARNLCLETFASNAIAHGSPYDIARIALALAPEADDVYFGHLTDVVDQLIISDDEYMQSLEGIDCALIHGNINCHAGKAQRGLQIWHRAITCAHLIGLHKNRTSLEADKLWWNLYQFDRFMSLMMATPYHISDAHCNMNFRHFSSSTSIHSFFSRLSSIVGKVIDHVQKSPDSLTSVDDMRIEIDLLTAQMPTGFWQKIPTVPRADPTDDLHWRGRAMSQIALFQTAFALHIPYILKDEDEPRITDFQARCVQAARDILSIYNILRHPSNLTSVECKGLDHVGFAATVLLLLVLKGYRRMKSSLINEEKEEYQRLVDVSLEILKYHASQPREKVALQHHRTLQDFLKIQPPGTNSTSTTVLKLTIPFFGLFAVSSADFSLPASTSLSTVVELGPTRILPSNASSYQSTNMDPPIDPSWPFTESEPIDYTRPSRHMASVNQNFATGERFDFGIDNDWNSIAIDIPVQPQSLSQEFQENNGSWLPAQQWIEEVSGS
jgi:hypothetical protein